MRFLLAGTILAACLFLMPASPARADSCTDDARPCSPRCIHLGNLYDQRYQAVERVNRKLSRNTHQLSAALKQEPIDDAKVDRLQRRDSYLRKLYHRRHVRLMRTYRKFLRTCF